MKGLSTKPEIKESDLDEFVRNTLKSGRTKISITTPSSQETYIWFELKKQPKHYVRVLVDTYPCGWDINEGGQNFFVGLARNYPEDIKEPFCRKRVMRVDVRYNKGEYGMWGIGLWLMYMLKVLEKGENLKEIKIS